MILPLGSLVRRLFLEQDGVAPAWWDVHGADLQRYYNLVCLFVGAAADQRSDIAQDLELPQDRFETCEEEAELAYDSWGPVLDDLAAAAPGDSLVYRGRAQTLTEQLVAQEVAVLNAEFEFPVQLGISVQSCGEPNAYYDPQTIEIVMCAEFAQWLRDLPLD